MMILDKMTNHSFILSVKRQLLDIICEEWTEDSLKLIRKHDKNLESGDLHFPRLDNNKAWV